MRISDEQIVVDSKRLARRFTPYGFNKQDKEDIAQEVAIALLEARERFDPEISSWSNFSLIRARGTVQDYMRKHVIQEKDLKRSGILIEFSSYDKRIHEIAVEETYDIARYKEFLRTLSVKERFIVICILSGYTAAEIASMLNTSIVMIHRALQNLRIVNSRSWLYQQK